MTLPDYITANLTRPFVWGVHDCVRFAIGWMDIATGRDNLAPFGTWSNEKEAMRIVKKLGGLKKAMNANLKQIHPHLAQDGHIALYKKSLCIFSGNKIVGAGPNGLTFINRMEAECAWSF